MSPLRITVGFSTSHGPVSRLIRVFTKSKVSHTFLVVELLGQEIVMEAASVGFRMTTLARFKEKNTIVGTFEPAVSLEPGLKRALTFLGEGYDFGGLLGMAVVMAGRWFRRKWRNPLQDAHAMFCSEANTIVLQASKYPGADALDPTETTPADLMSFMANLHGGLDPRGSPSGDLSPAALRLASLDSAHRLKR